MDQDPRPRAGVRLDPAKLDYELARRGITAKELGARIGLSEVGLSRARNGHCVREGTLRRDTIHPAALRYRGCRRRMRFVPPRGLFRCPGSMRRGS